MKSLRARPHAPPASTRASPPCPPPQAAGIDPATPRDAWPLPPLLSAFAALQRSVDAQLLARELWVGAAGAADWWRRSRSFAASVSAMSVVGYLLGLGDRHLDNVLLHRRGGHVTHVDFSLLFDRCASVCASPQGCMRVWASPCVACCRWAMRTRAALGASTTAGDA